MTIEKLMELVGDAGEELEKYNPYVFGVLTFKSNSIKNKDVEGIKKEMEQYIKSHSAEKTGSFTVLVNGANVGEGDLSIDIFVPINKAISSSRKFKYMEQMKMDGCIMSKYQGFFLPPDINYINMKKEGMERVAEIEEYKPDVFYLE